MALKDESAKRVYLYPVESFYQMRRAFKFGNEDFKLTTFGKRSASAGVNQTLKKEDAKKESESLIKQRELARHLESKLRNYAFQKEIYDKEETKQVDFYPKVSEESKMFWSSLTEPPKRFKSVENLPKSELISLLRK